jgi:hypothetical protein
MGSGSGGQELAGSGMQPAGSRMGGSGRAEGAGDGRGDGTGERVGGVAQGRTRDGGAFAREMMVGGTGR